MNLNSDDDKLAELRNQINESDREIIRCILKRAELAKKIGSVKDQKKTSVYRPDREREVYRNVWKYAQELYGDNPPFDQNVLTNIYREIMSGSLAIEGGPGIAFLGPLASFSHMATRSRFGSSIREFPVETISDVFRTVESGGDVSYGIVPIENSSGGSIGVTLEMLLETELKIYAELYIRVSQNLLTSKHIPLDQIKKLYTIRIVREQCRNWLKSNLCSPDLEVIETSSTAAAAKAVAERKDGAAIASELAAQTYGLEIQERNIQDSSNNITRFIVLGSEQCKPTGDDKTSIVCSVKDRPGSLFEMIEPFYSKGINLSRIESMATRKSYGDYNFFIDFLGHTSDPDIKKILARLETKTSMLKILGSYPRADLPR